MWIQYHESMVHWGYLLFTFTISCRWPVLIIEFWIVDIRFSWVKDYNIIMLVLQKGKNLKQSFEMTFTRKGHHWCHSQSFHCVVSTTKFENPLYNTNLLWRYSSTFATALYTYCEELKIQHFVPFSIVTSDTLFPRYWVVGPIELFFRVKCLPSSSWKNFSGSSMTARMPYVYSSTYWKYSVPSAFVAVHIHRSGSVLQDENPISSIAARTCLQ